MFFVSYGKHSTFENTGIKKSNSIYAIVPYDNPQLDWSGVNWTVKIGDYIIKGEVEENYFDLEALKEKYTVYEITTATYKEYGLSPHLHIEGV